MRTFKKTVCVLIAVLLMAAFAGCGYNPETVMTVNGMDIPCGIYLYYQMTAAALAQQEYQTATGEEETKAENYLDGTLDGIPVRDWINDKTVTLIKQYVYIETEAERLGIEMTDIDYYYAENYLGTYWQYFSANYMKNGINQETYLKTVYNTYKSSMVLDKLFNTGGEHEIPQAELEKIYTEKFANADYIKFPTTDVTGAALDLNGMKAVLDAATAIQAEAQETGDLKAAFLNHGKEILIATAELDAGADDATAATAVEEKYTSLVKENALLRDGDGTLTTDEMAAVAGADEGSYRISSTDTSILLFCKKPFTEDQTLESQRETLVAMAAEQPFLELRDKTIEHYEVQADQKARDYYSLDKVVLI